MNNLYKKSTQDGRYDPFNADVADPIDPVGVDASMVFDGMAVSNDDGDPTVVESLPLGPTFASDEGDGFNPLPDRTPFVSAESEDIDRSVDDVTYGGASFAAVATGVSQDDPYYTDNQLSIISDLGLTGYIANDMTTGPTITDDVTTPDLLLKDSGELFANYGRYVSGLFLTLRERVISEGVMQVDPDTAEIDMTDLISYKYWTPKGATKYTDYKVYSGVDASDATSHVTYYGIDKNKWYTARDHDRSSNPDSYLDENGLPNSKSEYHVTYEYKNVFKGGDFGNLVYGGSYADTLIGGQGDDEIHGVGGKNVIYGVGGDNYIDGGTGSSTIFGGTGNDFIRTGTGNNTVVLSGGDNWIVVEQNKVDGTKYSNTLVAGSGTDTFVIGNIPPAEETRVSTMDEWTNGLVADTGLSVAKDVVGAGIGILGAANPVWGFMTTGAFSVIGALVDGKPSDIVMVTEYPAFKATIIENFNPLTDRLLLPMDADGSINLSVRDRSDDGSSYDLEIYDNTSGTPLAYINLASKEEIFGTSGGLSQTERVAFNNAIKSSLFIVDADGIQYGSGANNVTIDVDELGVDALSDLGAGRFMFGGAWSGRMMFGGVGEDAGYQYMGTVHDDVLFGFDLFSNSVNPDPGSNKTFYGFAGSNFFAPGGGSNIVYGGTDTDTVTYEYSDGAISVDMSTTYVDSINAHKGAYFKALNGFGDGVDKLYSVEAIVGSDHGDTIIGNEEDNTFYSTGGENQWTGTGGYNTFFLNGGSVQITDFSDGDSIVIEKSAYHSASVNTAQNLRWVEHQDQWELYDRKTQAAIVSLDKSDGFDSPGEVTLLRHDGVEKIFTPNSTFLSEELVA